ncbi:MAG: hypothetical protein AB8B82_05940 [Roseovarius sp.]
MIERASFGGLAYVIAAFAFGFVLGTLRVFGLVPWLGETLAVLLELPVMLGFCWWVSAKIISGFNVPSHLTARLWMGGLAFGLLMLAELGLSIFGFGQTISGHFAQYLSLHGLLGLTGQVVFGLIPTFQLR